MSSYSAAGAPFVDIDAAIIAPWSNAAFVRDSFEQLFITTMILLSSDSSRLPLLHPLPKLSTLHILPSVNLK